MNAYTIEKYLNKIWLLIFFAITILFFIVVSPIIILYSYSNWDSNTEISDANPEMIGHSDSFIAPYVFVEDTNYTQMRVIKHKTLGALVTEPYFKRVYLKYRLKNESSNDYYIKKEWLNIPDHKFIYQVSKGDFNFRHAPEWFSSVALAEKESFNYVDRDGNSYLYYEFYVGSAGSRPRDKWGK